MFLGGCLKRTSSYFFIFCLFFVINPTNYKSIAHKIPSLPFLAFFCLQIIFPMLNAIANIPKSMIILSRTLYLNLLYPLFHFSCPKTASTSTGLLLLCSNPFGEVSFSRASCLYHLSLWFTLSPNL